MTQKGLISKKGESMSWFYRNNAFRAAELNTMAFLTWQRRSKDPQHKLVVCLAYPDNPDSAFVVWRDGAPSHPIKRSKEVQKYIRRYYDNLLYNGSGAPDDVFLDSMKSVTKK